MDKISVDKDFLDKILLKVDDMDTILKQHDTKLFMLDKKINTPITKLGERSVNIYL